AFYREIAHGTTTFALPEVIEQGQDGGIAYSVDRLIDGRPLDALLSRLHRIERDRALASYRDAAFEIAPLPCNRPGYGEFLRDDDAIHAGSWSEYLLARMRRSLHASPWLAIDVAQLDVIVDALAERIRALPPAPPTLVHGDYFPGNVLMSDALTVAGVIDFGPLTVIGDPALDLVSALTFLELAPGCTPDDTEFVRARLTARGGPAMLDAMTTYRGWYAIRFAPYRLDDPKLYAWCVHSLREVAHTLLAG
ncbi:MAG TPA: phosphotransferase, partial [Dehalococcoidia bacterium]